jgi:LacI family transcriptional regulator
VTGGARRGSGPPILAVARQAGVSISTVSRVLSPSGHKVNERTRQRVLDAARELRYVPSALPQAMLKHASRIVGVLIGDNTDPYFAQILAGVEAVAAREGFITIVSNTGRDPAEELRRLRLLRGYRASGVILAGGGLDDAGLRTDLAGEAEALRAGGTIVVATTRHRLNVPHVRVDGEGGVALAARHLLELGHRRIGFVSGPAGLTVSRTRAQAFRGALAEAGVDILAALVAEGDFTREGGEAAGARLLDLCPRRRPTAIFAANDLTAVGVLAAADARGIRVPQDLSVVGFDDMPLADAMRPPLTTVRLPLRELGEAAMEVVLAGVALHGTERNGAAGAAGEPGDPASTRRPPQVQDGHTLAILPTHLIVRQSSAPPPRGDR